MNIPRYVTAAQIAAARLATDLIDSSRAKRLQAFRLRVLLGVLWTTGARISEVLALRAVDVDWKMGIISIQTLKRRKAMRRTLPLPSETLTELSTLGVLGDVRGHERFFPFERAQAHALISRVLLAVGVPPESARPHAIRHGHALHLISSGVPLNLIQQQLGHSSIVTTSHYLTATGDDLKRAYQAVKW